MKTHNWQDCISPECEECQRLIDDDVLIACDFCDAAGHKDSIGSWVFVNIEKTEIGEIGQIACSHCATSNV